MNITTLLPSRRVRPKLFALVGFYLVYLTATEWNLEEHNRNRFLSGRENDDSNDIGEDLDDSIGTVFSMRSTFINLPEFLFPQKPAQCLNLEFDRSMDLILSSTKQVFVTMPAKVAGTSLSEFTQQCMKSKYGDDFDNSGTPGVNLPWMNKDFLKSTHQLPSIITSHLFGSDPLISLAKHATKNSLIIHMHREETDRSLSAIKDVLTNVECSKDPSKEGSSIISERNETHCILQEDAVIDIIEKRESEIGAGVYDILSCDSYKAIHHNAPNMVLVHYTQANQLQKLLAKHHCPELLNDPPKEINVSTEQGLQVYLRLSSTPVVVKLDDWLGNKEELLEYSLQLKKEVTCQGKTKHMQHDLFACQNQAIIVTPSNIKYW